MAAFSDGDGSTKPSGVDGRQPRYLPELSDIPALLDIRERPWPDGELVVSFAIRAYWACGRSPREFAQWWESLRAAKFLRQGFHYVLEGEEPFVDVLHGALVASSRVEQAAEALKIVSERAYQIRRSAGHGIGPLPLALRAETEVLARLASKPVPSSLPRTSMRDGTTRFLTTPAGVPSALSLDWRHLGGSETLTASVRGLWSCTAASRRVEDWFSGHVATLGLRDGRDFEGDFADGGDVVVAARHARLLLLGVRTEGALAAVALVESAFHEPGPPEPDRVSQAGPADAGSDPPQGSETAPADGSADEPWAEAFEFGRLVPVMDREVGGVVQPTVSARDVHRALGLARQFTNWIDERFAAQRLVVGVDYEPVIFNVDVKDRGRGPLPKQYALTLATAKKIAMSSETERGNAIREYFIECERRLQAGEPPIGQPAGLRSAVAEPVSLDPLADPLFMSMAAYLGARGVPERLARREAAASERTLAASAIADGLIDFVRLASGPSWRFAVALLDRWWVANRTRLLASLAGRSALPRPSSGTGS